VVNVRAGAPEEAVVAVVDTVALGLDQHLRLLVGEEQPLAVLRPERTPRDVDVDAQPGHDAAQVGALPGARPCSDRTLADAQRGVRHHQVLADVVLLTQPVAALTRSSCSVGRERLRLQPQRTVRVGASARVEHPHQVGQCGQGAHGRAGARGTAPLLECHGRRQPGDLLHVRGTDLLQQPTGVGRHRLEIATLRLGVEGAEGQRRLARAGDTGKGDHRVTWQVDVDVLKVVLGGAADLDEAVAQVVMHTPLSSRSPTGAHHRMHDQLL
jgi:hypothetical protein